MWWIEQIVFWVSWYLLTGLVATVIAFYTTRKELFKAGTKKRILVLLFLFCTIAWLYIFCADIKYRRDKKQKRSRRDE